MKLHNLMVFGFRGSGKDTLVDYLTSKYEYQKLRLAWYVEVACRAFGIENPTKTDLVFIGTEIGRNLVDRDVWVKMALKDIKKDLEIRSLYNMDYNVIVSDVRFHNEYEAFLGRGFFPVLVEAPKDLCIARVKKRDGHVDESLFKHQTETNFNDFFGYKITNDGTMEHFISQIDLLMQQLEHDSFYKMNMDMFKSMYAERKSNFGK